MELTLEECKKVLYNYSSSFDIKTYKLNRFSQQLEGFLGDHYILEITYTEKKNEVRASFFVKTLPASTHHQHTEYIQGCGFFRKELILYQNLFPCLQSYFREKFVPNQYLIKMDTFIVLENLKEKGYNTFGEELTIRHCYALLDTLARFHTASIIFEEEQFKTDKSYSLYDNFSEALFEAFFVFEPGHPRQVIFENTMTAVMDIFNLTDQKDKKSIMKKLENFARNKVVELVKPSQIYRNSLTHCDLWRNNMMFRETSNKLECLLVDFQFTRYVPPTWDVLLTLYLNCSSQFLKENMESLLTYYFHAFRQCLKLHHIDSNKIMNKDQFIQSVEVYKPVALLEALFFSTMIFVDNDLSKKMVSNQEMFVEYTYVNRSKYVVEEFKNNEYFRRRFTDILLLTIKCFDAK